MVLSDFHQANHFYTLPVDVSNLLVNWNGVASSKSDTYTPPFTLPGDVQEPTAGGAREPMAGGAQEPTTGEQTTVRKSRPCTHNWK
jgi:hypothetical protein